VRAAADILGIKPETASYEGTHIFTSYNPATDEGKKFRNWATTWLDRQPGIIVQVRERKPKAPPKCPKCRQEIARCPHSGCGSPMIGTVEKGIDTLLATDLIRLAFADTYDAAVIASLDADMVPAVQFVQTNAKKIIQAGFPPKGIDLATECWGSFDIMAFAADIEREAP
jgi:uncharacterized LabA/DUF88 family protein